MDASEFFIAGPAGRLEARLDLPPAGVEPRAAVVLCHPHPLHGGTLHNTVVFRTMRGLTRAGLAVLRFNFRGVSLSEGRHDGAGGEVSDAAAALDWLEERFPRLEHWGAGFSFGALTVSSLGRRDDRLDRLLFVAMPVAVLPCEGLELIRQPALFLCGGADEFGTLACLQQRLPVPPEHFEFDELPGADHLFRKHSKALEERIFAHARNAPTRSLGPPTSPS